MRVVALFMTCSWTLTELRFIHKSKVKRQQKLYAGVGDRCCDFDGRECGVGCGGVCEEHEKHLFIVT